MSKITGSNLSIDSIYHQYFSSIGKDLYPTQRKIIESVISGNNTLGLMPTGGGKSLCYWIAGKVLQSVTIVIFPLTALMDEQAQKLEQHGCSVFTLHSGIDSRKQYRELLDLYNKSEKPDFIFMSPERLATDGFLEYVLKSIREKIKLVVVDEAHCISQWGMDFRPFYKEIPFFLKAIFQQDPLPTILCLSATLNPKDQQQICADFKIESEHVIKSDMLLRPLIDIQVVKVINEDEKDQKFWDLLEDHKSEKILIYLDRKRGKRATESLCAEALQRGFKADFFHADIDTDKKIEIINQFKSGELLTVFATSAFGMGIDIPDIRGVIHYLLTESAEQYYQQIGRVGRDGEPSWAVLFYSDKNVDVRRQHFIIKSFPTQKDISFAFSNLTDDREGIRTVNYFNEGDITQSGYHYLVRSRVIEYISKGIESLDVFQIKSGVTLPEYETFRKATFSGALVPTARKIGISEPQLLEKIYSWLAENKIVTTHSPSKCLVINALVDSLPEDLLQDILADVEEKKIFRLNIFSDYVDLLQTYTNSIDFHKKIGEYLGIDRFSRERSHQTLSGDLVRSKSEVIIANILYKEKIPFKYEETLYAPDRTWRVPDFTINWKGNFYYWEHLGMLDVEDYHNEWQIKKAWYEKHFPNQLITTKETSTLSKQTQKIIAERFDKGD